jgi:hypothetical protein
MKRLQPAIDNVERQDATSDGVELMVVEAFADPREGEGHEVKEAGERPAQGFAIWEALDNALVEGRHKEIDVKDSRRKLTRHSRHLERELRLQARFVRTRTNARQCL